MAEKKKSSESRKRKIDKAPPLSERITDFSTGGVKNITFIPKKKK